jgi:AbiV family abortive infection protein
METQSVTAPYLLKGAVYALEQCGLLLLDASLLYRNGSFATAVVLTTFAREELGRWQILLKLRREVLSEEQLSLEEVRARCKTHDAKHRHGWLVASSYDRPEPTAIANAIDTMSNAAHGSSEWQAAKDEYERLNAHLKKTVPAERQANRMSALYVDPISVTEWNRPAKTITRQSAFTLLLDVGNEYGLEAAHGYSDLASVATKDTELAAALEQWTDRPTMPARELVSPPTVLRADSK